MMAGRESVEARIMPCHAWLRDYGRGQQLSASIVDHGNDQISRAYNLERDPGLVKHRCTCGIGKCLLGNRCPDFSSRVRSSRSHQQHWTRPRAGVSHSILLHHPHILISGQCVFCRRRRPIHLVNWMRAGDWNLSQPAASVAR